MKKFLAIDLGAGSGRAVLGIFSSQSQTISLKEIHRFPNCPVNVCGNLYWDILNLYRGVLDSIRLCVSNHSIDSIAVDAWGVDFSLLDEDGRLVCNPFHYRDPRTEGIPQKVHDIVDKSYIYSQTGIQTQPLNTLFQLFSMRNTSALRSSHSLLFIADTLSYFLTGKQICEYSVATTSQLFSLVKNDWMVDVAKKLEIPLSVIPRNVVSAGMTIGSILPHVAEETGAPSETSVIAALSHDTASAFIAIPAETSDSSWGFLSSGTWSLLGIPVSSPILTEDAMRMNFQNEGNMEGLYRFQKNIPGMWMIQELRREWNDEHEYRYSELTDMAMKSRKFVALLNVFHTPFTEAGNMVRKIKEFCSNSGQEVPKSEGEFVRVVLESLALAYRRTMETLEDISGCKISTLFVVGGGSKNSLLNEFTANASGRQLVVGPVEATAIGNTLVQGMASGVINSVSHGREIVRNSFRLGIVEPNLEETQIWDEMYKKSEEFF